MPAPTTPHPVPAARGRARRIGTATRSLALALVVLAAVFATTACDPLTKAVGGTYRVTYATAGSVDIHVAGDHYTVSVRSPFRLEGMACSFPTDTVIATFGGAGPSFAGGFRYFNDDCTPNGGGGAMTATLNDDGSISLGGSTGVHVLTKTANEVVVPSPALTGDYRVVFATAGAVTVHTSGTTTTVSVKTPFRMEGMDCSFPVDTVIAQFSGVGPAYSGGFKYFNRDCTPTGGGGAIGVWLNTDNTITLGTSSGLHLLTRTADQTAVPTPTLAGDYHVVFATTGSVTVALTGADVATVTVRSPFRLEGMACALPTGTVIAQFSGAGPAYGGGFKYFNSDCTPTGGGGTIGVWLNTDNTITLGTSSGLHLLSPI